MPDPGTTKTDELDVRQVPKPQRHPLIFNRFATLPALGSFVLVNSHDPKHLRQEFERGHPGTYTWQYLETGPTWRIQITKLTATDVPCILGNARAVISSALSGEAAGAVWKLEISQRHLEANIIHLQPERQIEAHTGPDLDVFMYVLHGGGQLATETDAVVLAPGFLVWLPRRSQRSITAGPTGLSYLTVHPRRPALSIDAAPASIALA
jgi:uncharacterized protein (DUF2249 family)/quercetin dioxygenase-like cupin family protein